jgi:hypothetical protein
VTLHSIEIASFLAITIGRKNVQTKKHNPTINRPKPASSGSATTPEVAAEPLKEAGAAGSLFTVVSLVTFFCGKRK